MELSGPNSGSCNNHRSSHTVQSKIQSVNCPKTQVERRDFVADKDVSITLAGKSSICSETTQERQYRKCIYIGNLPPSASLDQITENVKHIYAGEIASNTVKDVEALINQEGTEHTMSKSVCVVLTSHPGQNLQDLPLKQDHYPYHLRKNVRVWRGRPPWPENHAMAKAKIELPHAW